MKTIKLCTIFRHRLKGLRLLFPLLSLLLAFSATLPAQERVQERVQEKAQENVQRKTPVLILVSVDGMKPEYVTHAEEHGAKVPNLRRMMA